MFVWFGIFKTGSSSRSQAGPYTVSRSQAGPQLAAIFPTQSLKFQDYRNELTDLSKSLGSSMSALPGTMGWKVDCLAQEVDADDETQKINIERSLPRSTQINKLQMGSCVKAQSQE